MGWNDKIKTIKGMVVIFLPVQEDSNSTFQALLLPSQISSKMEYCGYVWLDLPNSHYPALDRIQNQLQGFVGDYLFSFLEWPFASVIDSSGSFRLSFDRFPSTLL